jgi:hypothetical protein
MMLLTLIKSFDWLMSPSNIFRFASGGITAGNVLAGCGGCGCLGSSLGNYARPVALRQPLRLRPPMDDVSAVSDCLPRWRS